LGKSIFTISGKGGTGKTTVGAGVTSCLGILGSKTVLIDVDCGLRNADIILGVSDKTVMHLGDVLSGKSKWEDALVKHPEIPNLSVLAAPSLETELDINKFRALVGFLAQKFDFVWIDGPAGLNEKLAAMADMADSVIVVVTPDVVSMRDAARVAEMLGEDKDAYLVVNRVRPRLIMSEGAIYIDDIMDNTGIPLLGVVPEDERVIAVTNKGIPLVSLSQDGAAAAYRDIALRLLGERVPAGEMKVTSKATRAFLAKLNHKVENDL
jgi:septum site-determining protein MinD